MDRRSRCMRTRRSLRSLIRSTNCSFLVSLPCAATCRRFHALFSLSPSSICKLPGIISLATLKGTAFISLSLLFSILFTSSLTASSEIVFSGLPAAGQHPTGIHFGAQHSGECYAVGVSTDRPESINASVACSTWIGPCLHSHSKLFVPPDGETLIGTQSGPASFISKRSPLMILWNDSHSQGAMSVPPTLRYTILREFCPSTLLLASKILPNCL